MMEKQSRKHQEGWRQQPQQQEEEVVMVMHSQVMRIKQEEDERAKVHETYQHHVSEMRRGLRDLDRQRSRSPLGRAARTAISIGGDS